MDVALVANPTTYGRYAEVPRKKIIVLLSCSFPPRRINSGRICAWFTSLHYLRCFSFIKLSGALPCGGVKRTLFADFTHIAMNAGSGVRRWMTLVLRGRRYSHCLQYSCRIPISYVQLFESDPQKCFEGTTKTCCFVVRNNRMGLARRTWRVNARWGVTDPSIWQDIPVATGATLTSAIWTSLPPN